MSHRSTGQLSVLRATSAGCLSWLCKLFLLLPISWFVGCLSCRHTLTIQQQPLSPSLHVCVCVSLHKICNYNFAPSESPSRETLWRYFLSFCGFDSFRWFQTLPQRLNLLLWAGPRSGVQPASQLASQPTERSSTIEFFKSKPLHAASSPAPHLVS